jgi:hypothetical protein
VIVRHVHRHPRVYPRFVFLDEVVRRVDFDFVVAFFFAFFSVVSIAMVADANNSAN